MRKTDDGDDASSYSTDEFEDSVDDDGHIDKIVSTKIAPKDGYESDDFEV